MADDKDLVARLRRGPITVGVLDEAADRIEALEARSVPEGLETTAEERAELLAYGGNTLAVRLTRDHDTLTAALAAVNERAASETKRADDAEYALQRFKEARDKLPDWEKLWAEQSEAREQAEAERDREAAARRTAEAERDRAQTACEQIGIRLNEAEAREATLRAALVLLLADVEQYPAYQRPVAAVEVARAALATNSTVERS